MLGVKNPVTLLSLPLPTTFPSFHRWMLDRVPQTRRLSPLRCQAFALLIEEVRNDLGKTSEQERCEHFAALAELVLTGKHSFATLGSTVGKVHGLPKKIARRHGIGVPAGGETIAVPPATPPFQLRTNPPRSYSTNVS